MEYSPDLRYGTPALHVLQRFGTRPLIVSEALFQTAVAALREAGGPMCTVSGAAGLAGLLHIAESPSLRISHHLSADSTVLLITSEGAIPCE
jgi:diaminopropionate ammonia-lyase